MWDKVTNRVRNIALVGYLITALVYGIAGGQFAASWRAYPAFAVFPASFRLA